MKGDFTRDTFDRTKHFSRVLAQQGRVTLDADSNEQAAILLHYLRTLTRDLIGPYAAPLNDNGFVLSSMDSSPNAPIIGRGRCYVDGILVENEQDCLYWKPESESGASASLPAQPNYPVPENDGLRKEWATTQHTAKYWLFLDVWERHITPVEDDSILEKALDGSDTCARAKVIWQVKSMDTDQILADLNAKLEHSEEPERTQLEEDIKAFKAAVGRTTVRPGGCAIPLRLFSNLSNASLAARVDPGAKTENACVTPPASKYRGAENQLYRVEIHMGGDAAQATFKWSRDNGSNLTAWLDVSGNDLRVASVRGFAAGNWVELSDDSSELLGEPGTLVRVVKVEGDTLTVDPGDTGATLPSRSDDSKHPKVRRWDQVSTDAVTLVDGAMPIQESAPGDDVWIDLEDGVQIQFSEGGEYTTGDFWLIPARVATGNVEWPQDDDLNPQPLPPHGVEHHYASLGFVWWNADGMQVQLACGCIFYPLNSCAGYYTITQQTDKLSPIEPPRRAPSAAEKDKPIKPSKKKSSRPVSPKSPS